MRHKFHAASQSFWFFKSWNVGNLIQKIKQIDVRSPNMLSHAAILGLCTLATMSSFSYQWGHKSNVHSIFNELVSPGEYYMLSLLHESIIKMSQMETDKTGINLITVGCMNYAQYFDHISKCLMF